MSAYLDWKVGDRVVRVRDGIGGALRDEKFPQVGSIYTIRTIEADAAGVFIRLVEIVNPVLNYAEGLAECDFDAENFRKVQPRKTSIAIFERFLNDAEAPIREEV